MTNEEELQLAVAVAERDAAMVQTAAWKAAFEKINEANETLVHQRVSAETKLAAHAAGAGDCNGCAEAKVLRAQVEALAAAMADTDENVEHLARETLKRDFPTWDGTWKDTGYAERAVRIDEAREVLAIIRARAAQVKP